MIYLDNAATSFPKPERVYVRNGQMYEAVLRKPGQVRAQAGPRSGQSHLQNRERLCRLFNIESPMQVVFTSNATEALNLGIKGLLKEGDHVVTTSMEHNSVARPLTALKAKGVSVTYIGCDSKGHLNPRDIERAIKKNTALIIITHASNVTGTLMPVKEVGCIAKERGIPFMLDAPDRRHIRY